MPVEVTKELLHILKGMKERGFKLIDAPLRHVFITKNGYKMVDHVFAFTREQNRPLELFQNLYERGFLDDFLAQVKELDPELHAEWTKEPIPLEEKEDPVVQITNQKDRKSWKKEQTLTIDKEWKKKKRKKEKKEKKKWKEASLKEKEDKKKKKKKDKKRSEKDK